MHGQGADELPPSLIGMQHPGSQIQQTLLRADPSYNTEAADWRSSLEYNSPPHMSASQMHKGERRYIKDPAISKECWDPIDNLTPLL